MHDPNLGFQWDTGQRCRFFLPGPKKHYFLAPIQDEKVSFEFTKIFYDVALFELYVQGA